VSDEVEEIARRLAAQATKPSTCRDLARRLVRARDRLHACCDRGVAQAELADAAALSQFHFARLFRAAFGLAPIAYHRRLRLERAAGLLAAGGRTLAEVAELTGYSDQVALAHAFRKAFGIAPQAWAAQARGEKALPAPARAAPRRVQPAALPPLHTLAAASPAARPGARVAA
jgi:transcriptional regulator GlxA family with amidase domain